MALADELHKDTGNLIRAADWNKLVAAVDKVQTDLVTGIDNLKNQIEQTVTPLQTQVTQLQADFTQLQTRVNNIFTQYAKVTVTATKAVYAIGEVAEIAIQVTDIEGNAFQPGGGRPFIDLITSWGRFKAVPGFETRGGFGDRAISVRTDETGLARVRLQPENAEGINPDTENEFAGTLTATVPETNLSIADTILRANTPIDAKPAFRLMSAQYDRADALSVRRYSDAYFAWQTQNPVLTDIDFTTGLFREYRSTIMASVTVDGDPTTPDQSRGVTSMQITYRDWFRPWIFSDYLFETQPLETDFRTRFESKITPDFNESNDLLRGEVSGLLENNGLIEKIRNLDVIHTALDKVNPAQPPAFLNTLTRSAKDAVRVQQSLTTANSLALGPEANRAFAFEAFSSAATRSESNTVGLQTQLAELKNQTDQFSQGITALNGEVTNIKGTITGLGDLRGNFTGLQQQFQAFQQLQADHSSQILNLNNNFANVSSRVDAVLSDTGPLQNIRADLNTVRGQVANFQALNPSDVNTRLGQLNGLENRLTRLELQR